MRTSLAKVVSRFALFGLAVFACPVSAHHATSMFDDEKVVPLVGTVKEVHWANPHVSIVVENTGRQGTAAGLWVIELTSPARLTGSGWMRTSVKPGDKVTADIHPLRDGTRGGALRKLSLVETGHSYTYNIRERERPNLGQGYARANVK
jgi:hypothetical protein